MLRAKAGAALKFMGRRIASALSFNPDDWTSKDVVQALVSLGLFFSCAIAVGRWWQWSQGLVEFYSPVAWSGLALLILVFAPNRPIVVVGALAVVIFYGLKVAIVNEDAIGWLMVVGAAAASTLIVIFKASFFASYYEQTKSQGSEHHHGKQD